MSSWKGSPRTLTRLAPELRWNSWEARTSWPRLSPMEKLTCLMHGILPPRSCSTCDDLLGQG